MVFLNRISTHTRTIIYIGIVAITLIAYEPIRNNGFVSYDDPRYITANPDIKAGITWQSFGRAFTQPHYYMWHPLTTLVNMLNYELFGMNAVGHHIVSLLLHIISALLLFRIFSDMTGAIWASAFVAAVFAVHPVQVESVAWAAELKTATSGLFWLLTMVVYIRYTNQPRTGRYLLLQLVFGLCILTKPTVVTLPFVLLLLDYWPLGRVKWGRSIIEKIPLLVMSAILSAITFVASQRGGAVASLERIPLDFRIANMFISYMRYIGKAIWPSRLAVFYPPLPSNLPETTAVVCASLFILMTALSIYIGRRKRYIVVGWLWYVGALVPTIGLVQAGAQAMANRYMYIPILGLLIIIAWAVRDIIADRPRWKIIPAVLAVAALSSAIILTRMQVRHWQNSMTLFEYALQVSENNAVAENSYGCALFEAGRDSEAVLHLSNAVRISPIFSEARNNLGKVFLKQGKLNEAIACFNELINRKKDSAEVNYNLAVALSIQKKYDAAAKYFARTLVLDPKYLDVHSKMGAVLLAAGRADEAIPHLNEALQINPEQVEVYVKLGTAYTLFGKYELAIQNWTRAVELEPNNAGVLNNLAWLLATVSDASARKADKAIEFATRACELTGYNDPEQLDTLAVAYAAAGRFDDALAKAKQAVNIAKVRSQDKLVSEIQSRIELYQAGHSYIQK
jgi:tetratricopeptide (TPR) repeat protein